MVTSLSYRNSSGKELAIGSGRLKLKSADGLECPPVVRSLSQGPAIDGALAASARATERHILLDMVLDLQGLDEITAATLRRELCEAISDKGDEGVLTVDRAGRERWIGAMPAQEPVFKGKAWNREWQELRLEFICTRPYFMDVASQTRKIEFYESMTEFDEAGIDFPEDGRELSMILYLGMRIATIENPGNVEAPVKIRFTGPIINPYISNQTTGEMLRIPRILKEEEYIEIDTTPGRREIRLCMEGIVQNGMHYLDLASKFWKLIPGDNVIEIGDESPGEGSEASFEFYPHYREA